MKRDAVKGCQKNWRISYLAKVFAIITEFAISMNLSQKAPSDWSVFKNLVDDVHVVESNQIKIYVFRAYIRCVH